MLVGLIIGVFALQVADGTELDRGISFRESGGSLLVEAPCWSLALDAETGAIREIADRTAGGRLLWGGTNLWVIERHQDSMIEASQCTFKYNWSTDRRTLSLEFAGPEVSADVDCVARDEGPAWQAVVRMKRGTMIRWRFPEALQYDAARVREFIFPENLGLAFTRSFFQPGGAGVERHLLGSAGLLRVAEDRCRMRPVQDASVPVRAGDDAHEWLPEWYLREMPRWRVSANRCPEGDKHDLSLLETEHGTWLSAYRLGGWGWLFRLGGMLQRSDARPRTASVIATLARVYQRPASGGSEVPVPEVLAGKKPADWSTPPRRIGVVLARPTGRPGVRLQSDSGSLMRELARQEWVAQAEIRIVALRDPAELRAALDNPHDWFAIINTISEGFPAESAADADSMLGAIRDYVRHGGTWWEAGGGYPLFHAVVPQQDVFFETANRDFCDFAALDSEVGRWALFGIQSPESIFVPAHAEIASTGPADGRVGRYRHAFLAVARPGDLVSLPQQQMVLGQPHRTVLNRYALRNGLSRGLTEKAPRDVVERLKRCILLKVTTRNLRDSARIADDLPFPVLYHIADYLYGGFDKQYPDHLPPNPAVGTPEDLTRLIRACRENGHLFMPYTNPTWWCVNPKGPTFEQHGEAPLSRDLDDSFYPESYGSSSVQGYSVCPWHPAVRGANDVIRQQFTEQYPVDVLFQDQVGARRPRWDTNPAAPHPGAYLEGIHRIAQVDSASVPLGTEEGHDRLINWETMFCGLSWPWLPNRPSRSRVLYEDLWPTASYKIEPLALFLAHDKVLFYHHDLGGFVRNQRDLAITLAMGYGLSWWTRTAHPSAAERDWIERLCRLQAAIGPRCAGRPLEQFDYLAPQVIRSRWDDLEITANLSGEPWPTDPQTVVAPEGFVARAPDLEAGIFVRHAGTEVESGSRWLIRERQNGSWSEWTASEPEIP